MSQISLWNYQATLKGHLAWHIRAVQKIYRFIIVKLDKNFVHRKNAIKSNVLKIMRIKSDFQLSLKLGKSNSTKANVTWTNIIKKVVMCWSQSLYLYHILVFWLPANFGWDYITSFLLLCQRNIKGKQNLMQQIFLKRRYPLH